MPSLEESEIRRGLRPHRGRDWIGSRETEQILGVSRAVCNRLARSGKLPGRLIDTKGQRRHYEFRYADVKALKQSGEALKVPARPTRIRAAWLNLFGPIPEGFTVISRDGSHNNITPRNLALVPLRGALRVARRLRRRRTRTHWTLEMRAILLRDFATRSTDELATELGCSALAVRQQANRSGLRKSGAYLSERARRARALPLGTERLMTHDKNEGIVMVKVSNTGTQSQQWRPKQHLVYERATGKEVPKGWRVLFTDGNKENFDPANLEAVPHALQAAAALAHFIAAPAPFRKVARIHKTLQREIRHQVAGTEAPERKRGGGSRKGRALNRWTPAMLTALEKGYPTRAFTELAGELGVTVTAVKSQASKLGIRRELNTILADIAAKHENAPDAQSTRI